MSKYEDMPNRLRLKMMIVDVLYGLYTPNHTKSEDLEKGYQLLPKSYQTQYDRVMKILFNFPYPTPYDKFSIYSNSQLTVDKRNRLDNLVDYWNNQVLLKGIKELLEEKYIIVSENPNQQEDSESNTAEPSISDYQDQTKESEEIPFNQYNPDPDQVFQFMVQHILKDKPKEVNSYYFNQLTDDQKETIQSLHKTVVGNGLSDTSKQNDNDPG